MLRSDFQYMLAHKLLVTEGNLNSEIQRRTGSSFPFTPRFIMDQSELVRDIHSDFAKAGARIIIPGTAGANRLILEKNSLGEQFEEVNRQAVSLAKAAVTEDQLLFAGLGATDALLKPYGRLTESDYRDIFKEQAGLLLDAGVDGFIMEGFTSLIEAEQCILAVRELCAKPLIATMTFLEDGLGKFGDSMEDCFEAMLHAGADTVGIHATLGPIEIENFIARLSKTFPLCVRPNAGYPVRVGNKTTYLSSPEYVAECAEQFVDRGVNIIGGAMGFSPEHIAAISVRLRGRSPVKTGANAGPSITATRPEETSNGPTEEADRPLTRKLGREPVVSVEIEPPKGLEVDSIIELLQMLKPHGVDAVNIPENPLARARISSIALAKVIRERTGLESIAHLTCRDRNIISLQAELLGAHVLGVNTILALTGDPSGIGDFPTATSIFDVDSTGLVEIMHRMNLGKDFGMNDLGSATDFHIGVAANPCAKDMDAEVARLAAKVERGASFVQTQPIFDPKRVEPFLKAVDSLNVPVIFGAMLLRNYRHARFLANEYPGVYITDKDLDRFSQTPEEEQEKLGVTLAAELVRILKPMSGGIYLMAGFGDTDRLPEVFQQIEAP